MKPEEIKEVLLKDYTKDEIIDALLGGIVNTDRECECGGLEDNPTRDFVRINLETWIGHNSKKGAWVKLPDQQKRHEIYSVINYLWYFPSYKAYCDYIQHFTKKEEKAHE